MKNLLPAAGLAVAMAGAQANTLLSLQRGASGYAGTVDINLREADPGGSYGAEPELSIDVLDGRGPALTCAAAASFAAIH
jgi:hypothetical protein